MYLVFFFQKILFPVADLFALRYLWIVCNKDKCCVMTHAQRAADIRVAWLVYARTYCVPITTLNQITLFGRRPNNRVPSVVSKRGHTGHETKKTCSNIAPDMPCFVAKHLKFDSR